MQHVFESRFKIGDEVVVLNTHYGDVVAVHFTEDKVTYDVDLHVGGETMRNVDSTFVDALDGEFDNFRPLAPVFGPGGEAKLDGGVFYPGPLVGNAKTSMDDILGDPRVFGLRAQPRSFAEMLFDAGFANTARRDPPSPSISEPPKPYRCNDPLCFICGPRALSNVFGFPV